MIRRELHPTGLRLVTEAMPHVRSVSIGVWLTRGSRHESDARSGIAHFVEHMLFKGTSTRSAEDIAQTIDSIGGQMDAFTSKEYAGYYLKVLDEHVPLAVDVLSDIAAKSVTPRRWIQAKIWRAWYRGAPSSISRASSSASSKPAMSGLASLVTAGVMA